MKQGISKALLTRETICHPKKSPCAEMGTGFRACAEKKTYKHKSPIAILVRYSILTVVNYFAIVIAVYQLLMSYVLILSCCYPVIGSMLCYLVIIVC